MFRTVLELWNCKLLFYNCSRVPKFIDSEQFSNSSGTMTLQKYHKIVLEQVWDIYGIGWPRVKSPKYSRNIIKNWKRTFLALTLVKGFFWNTYTRIRILKMFKKYNWELIKNFFSIADWFRDFSGTCTPELKSLKYSRNTMKVKGFSGTYIPELKSLHYS